MASWSSRRKFIYGGSVIAIISAVIIGIFFFAFYTPPTCFDGIKNGSEQDVDCGGKCVKLCQSAFLPPKISWGGGKYEKISNNLYNLASYIVNPNTNGAAIRVSYKFTVYDTKGILITERIGKTTLPARRNVLVFEPAVNVGERTPGKATFEFLENPQWFKSTDNLGDLAIIDKKYSEGDNNSILEVNIENRRLSEYKDITVFAVLYDINNNAIGFSKTIIDRIPAKNGRETASFTWPVSRNGRVASIEVLFLEDPIKL